jgi:hypothetical protein
MSMRKMRLLWKYNETVSLGKEKKGIESPLFKRNSSCSKGRPPRSREVEASSVLVRGRSNHFVYKAPAAANQVVHVILNAKLVQERSNKQHFPHCDARRRIQIQWGVHEHFLQYFQVFFQHFVSLLYSTLFFRLSARARKKR